MKDLESTLNARASNAGLATFSDIASAETGRQAGRLELTTYRLAQWLPALASAADRDRVTPRMLYSYLTVESLVILVQRKLQEA